MLPILGVDPLTRLMCESIREDRLFARLAAAFGALVLVCARLLRSQLYGLSAADPTVAAVALALLSALRVATLVTLRQD